MRFLIREMDHETPLAAGRLRYLRDDQPTGAVESWRLTEVIDGYRMLRVDLDAREAASGHSYLYHLLLNANGRAERLKFRFFSANQLIGGDLLLENDNVTLVRDVSRPGETGRHFEETLDLAEAYRFWFPATAALGWLAATWQGAQPRPAVTLDPSAAFCLSAVDVEITANEEEDVAVARQQVAARPFLIRWQDQQRTAWLDRYGWPVKMAREAGLTAVESHYIYYQKNKHLWSESPASE